MLIPAFDPGLANTGWVVLDTAQNKIIDSGVIKTDAKQDKLERLFSLRQSVRAILQGYFQIEPTPEVAIEDFIFQKRTTTRGEEVPLPSAELLNRVVQVIVSECWALNMVPHLYPAPAVKEALTRCNRANKAAMKEAVSLRVASMPKSNHAIDACAVALYHADVTRAERLVKAGR